MSEINIEIDIQNNPFILNAIRDFLNNRGGWIVDGNTDPSNLHWFDLPNKTGRYFTLNLEDKIFSWATHDGEGNKNERFQPVSSVEEAISFVQFAVDNAVVFKIDRHFVAPVKTPKNINFDFKFNQIPEYFTLSDKVNVSKIHQTLKELFEESGISLNSDPKMFMKKKHQYYKTHDEFLYFKNDLPF